MATASLTLDSEHGRLQRAHYDSTAVLAQRYHDDLMTTREPENMEPHGKGYVGKRYLQDYITGEDFARDFAWEVDPTSPHVYLCGNPAMISVPHHTGDYETRYPVPTGMVEVLERQGFHIDRPHEPGSIHFETYW